MGVILDEGVRKDIERLETAGDFALADQLRVTNQVSLESLAFQTSIPSQYRALVESSVGYQTQKAHAEKVKREGEEERHERAVVLAAIYRQQEIDRNMLTFNVGGQDVRISQGDLRKVMEARVEELKERRKELLRSGRDPDEVNRIDDLLGEYEPTMDRLQKDKADAATMRAVQDLMRKDPPLADRAQKYRPGDTHPAANVTTERRTSFSSEYFDGGSLQARLGSTRKLNLHLRVTFS